jgi:hypothetical protein
MCDYGVIDGYNMRDWQKRENEWRKQERRRMQKQPHRFNLSVYTNFCLTCGLERKVKVHSQ